VAAAERHGLRHAALTAIDPQPRLALLANGIADALDPLPAEGQWRIIETPSGPRRIRACGYAQGMRRRHQQATGARPRNGIAARPVPGITDQILLRARLAPWFDAPIDYPFRLAAAPDPGHAAEWSALAAQHSLPPPRWQASPELDEG
jgi:ribonucleoside-diphosphate reductase alpha chain